MTMPIQEVKQENESFDRFYNRFTQRVRKARLVRRYREKQHTRKPMSERMKKDRAMHATMLREKRRKEKQFS